MSKGHFSFTKSDQDNRPMLGEKFTYYLYENFEGMWIRYPGPEVDLCILPFVPLINAARTLGVTLFFRTINESCLPSKEQIDKLDSLENIIMIGYPNGLWDFKKYYAYYKNRNYSYIFFT